jgi:hypothetical protein
MNRTTNDNNALIKFIGKQNELFSATPGLESQIFLYLMIPPIKPITIIILINSVHTNPAIFEDRLVLINTSRATGSQKNEYGAKHITFDK